MPDETRIITSEDVLSIAHDIARVAMDAKEHRLTISCNIHHVPLPVLNQIAAILDSQIEQFPATERYHAFQSTTITLTDQNVTLFSRLTHADT